MIYAFKILCCVYLYAALGYMVFKHLRRAR